MSTSLVMTGLGDDNVRTVMADDDHFSLQLPPSHRRENRTSKTRHSLPDLFDGLNSHQTSVSFQSPVVTSTPPSDSLLPPPPPAPTSSTSSSPPAPEQTKEDETLQMLQRHYLQAILSLAPPHKLSVSMIRTITSSVQCYWFGTNFPPGYISRLCLVVSKHSSQINS